MYICKLIKRKTDDEPARFCNCFVRQLLTKQVTYQQKLQSFSFFVGALRTVSYTHLDVYKRQILPLSIFIFLWLNDTGAYCIGSLIGKHRLFERISPKKSWEGSIGGGVVAIGVAFILAHYFPVMSMPEWAGLALSLIHI